MKKFITFIISLTLLFPVALTKNEVHAAGFPDIQNHWAKKYILTALDKGIVSGYPDNSFQPNKAVSRAEAAAMLNKITKLKPDSAAPPNVFPELETHWSKEAVRNLAALGVILPGDYAKGFRPDEKITRFEVMKWLALGLAKSDPDFSKALDDTRNTLLPTPEVYKGGIESGQIPYIALMKGTGIVSGFQDGTFRPKEFVTRAELIVSLLKYETVEGTEAATYRDLNELREVGLTGTNITSLTPFRFARMNLYDDKGRIKASLRNVIRNLGIDTRDFMTYDTGKLRYIFDVQGAKPYLSLPDTALIVYSMADGKIAEILDLPQDPSEIVRITLQAWDNQQSVLLGPKDPKAITDQEYDLYRSSPKLVLSIDKDKVPFHQFADVAEKPTQLGKLATVTLHRMIVVDATGKAGEKGKGVYANFFMDKIEPWMTGYGRSPTSDLYLVFSDFTYESHADKLDMRALLNAPGNARGTSLLSFQRVDDDLAAKKGIPTVPYRNFSQALSKGKSVRFWTLSSFKKHENYGPSFDTDPDGTLHMYNSLKE
ncbi:hypothetical protein GE107_16470 [Cohnella sp. CFH 77786]|uniref:S-layer homology domain-containing protein n=1 Tax=Cohnella sp. CFH 77786 TaxID=2662265 RepID=UPI001C60FFE7|nr:hypothetical protein [Cohnella sp. CFH 77786]